MTFGDKFSQKEVNEAYDMMYIDDKGRIDTESLIGMIDPCTHVETFVCKFFLKNKK